MRLETEVSQRDFGELWGKQQQQQQQQQQQHQTTSTPKQDQQQLETRGRLIHRGHYGMQEIHFNKQ